jgi:hypothetical protein
VQNELNLLIIEDTEEIITMYIDIINEKKSDVSINPFVCRTLEEGLNALDKHSFDGAIVDLKLGQNDQVGQGNALVKKILLMQRFPIYIVSAHLQDLDPELEKRSEFIRCYKKTAEISEVFDEVVDIYKTGITKIIGRRGLLDKYMDSIFWNHLSINIPYWVNKSKSINTERYLLRHTISHLQEYLELSDTQDSFDRYLDIEFYIYPPVKKNIFTGDIVVHNDKNYVVLSPTCDLAQGKAKLISLAEIEDIEMPLITEFRQKINKGTEEVKQFAAIEVGRLYRNAYSQKYHFIPNSPFFNGGFINFQKLISIRANEINNEMRLISISSSFTKDITSRFSQYYARQGQPDLDLDHLAL